MKQPKWKRVLGIALSGAIMVGSLSTALTAFAADDASSLDEVAANVAETPVGVRYAEPATEEQAQEAIATLDEILTSSELMDLLNVDADNLKDFVQTTVEGKLYTDSTISTLVTAIYPALYNLIADALEGAGVGGLTDILFKLATKANIYLLPKDVASQMDEGYAVKTELEKHDSWDTVDPAALNWGVTDEDSFYYALGQAFNGMRTILEFALTGESVIDPAVVGIKCDVKGYETLVKPLMEMLGCENIPAELPNNDVESLLRGILEPIVDRIYALCDAPADQLMNVLSDLAAFINDGKVASGLNININLVYLEGTAIGGTVTLVNVKTLINDLIGGTYPGATVDDINGLVKAIVAQQVPGFVLADLPLADLAADETSGAVLMTVLNYAGKVVCDNAAFIREQIDLSAMDPTLAAVLNSVIDQVLAADPEQIATLIIHLLAPSCDVQVSPYNYPEISKVEFVYPEGVNYGEDAYAQAPAAIDSLLTSFIDLKATVAGALYTQSLIDQVYGLYDTIRADATVAQVFAALGIDVSEEAINALKANGPAVTDKATFIDALANALSPFDGVLAFVLAGQDYNLIGASYPSKWDAYNSVVIPLLEALGCTDVMSYADYQAAVAKGESPLKAVLTQVFDRLDEILASPVDALVELLPNLAYFLSSNNLSVMLENIVAPLDTLLAHVDIDVNGIVNELLAALGVPAIDDIDNDLAGLLNQVLGTIQVNGAPLGIVLPAIDLAKLATYGTPEKYTSAMVVDGKNVEAIRIVADKADVTGAVIGYVYTLLTDNYDALMGLLGGLLGDSAGMVTGILDNLLGGGVAQFTNALFELLGLGDSGNGGSTGGSTGGVTGGGNTNVDTGSTSIAAGAGVAAVAAAAVLVLCLTKKKED